MTVTVSVKGNVPEKGRPTDAAYDLRAAEDFWLWPGDTKLIHTGTRLLIPEGYAGLVCSRSGLALSDGVFVLNAPGVIDHGYIGDVGVILHNAGHTQRKFNEGDRIAQLLIIELAPTQLVNVEELPSTLRSTEGFGSSGVA